LINTDKYIQLTTGYIAYCWLSARADILFLDICRDLHLFNYDVTKQKWPIAKHHRKKRCTITAQYHHQTTAQVNLCYNMNMLNLVVLFKNELALLAITDII